MKYLLDTHLLLLAAGSPERLSSECQTLLGDGSNELIFSVASLWEVVIKSAIGREDFDIDPQRFRNGLISHEYRELDIRSEHALAVSFLPKIHKDPFDRILVAQARTENAVLLTSDKALSGYPATRLIA